MSKINGKEPLILAIETSGRVGSVALAIGDRLLGETEFSAPMRHSAELFPAISVLLKDFDNKPEKIEHTYISSGPGSFTGLRIAVTFAKTIYLANDSVKIVAVDTLDVIASNVITLTSDKTSPKSEPAGLERIAVILDAKRGQFFIAVYEKQEDIWHKTLDDCLLTASQFIEKIASSKSSIWLLGEGLVYYKDKFKADFIKMFDEKLWWPKASKVHLLGLQKARQGNFSEPLTLQPNYLRKPQIGSSKILRNR